MRLNHLLSVFLVFILSSSVHANLRKKVGSVGDKSGKVLVDGKEASVSSDLREGSVIETGKNARATLLLGRGSVFHLGEDSRMVVTAFGVRKASESGAVDSAGAGVEEVGELDLKFGKTRALILNRSGEKKNLKIRARSATMGVRGTEIFVSSPKELSQPVQFFTLEGLAEVKAFDGAPVVSVAQNEGVAASGNPPASGNVPNEAPGGSSQDAAAGGGTSRTGGEAVEGKSSGGTIKLSSQQVKNEVQNSGLTPPPAIRTPGQVTPMFQPAPISMMPSVFQNPQAPLGPNDRERPNLIVQPTWCAGTQASCP